MRTIIAFLAGLVLVLLAPASRTWAQQGYLIQPGDVLRIEVIEDPSLNRTTLVSPDGRISVPLAGVVMAGGRQIEAVQTDLANLFAPNFATAPSVFVSIDSVVAPPAADGLAALPPAMEIFVLGEVGNPGRLGVAPGTTILQLFAEVGGFSKFAATKRIQLRRADASGTEKTYLINYDAIESGTSRSGSTTLQKGDVILVPQRRLFE